MLNSNTKKFILYISQFKSHIQNTPARCEKIICTTSSVSESVMCIVVRYTFSLPIIFNRLKYSVHHSICSQDEMVKEGSTDNDEKNVKMEDIFESYNESGSR